MELLWLPTTKRILYKIRMRYENRQPPEGINVTRVNPYTQFVKLLLGAIFFLVLLVVALQFVGGALAKRVPFSYEKKLSDAVEIDLGSHNASPQVIAYLNDVASRLTPGMELDEGVSIDVHYNEDNVFNAFATIGGNLVFYRALLEALPNENALAMVMAHEIAHVNHRDPVASLGGGVAAVVATSFVLGSSGMAENFLKSTYSVAGTQFTRSMESAADEAALQAVNSLYGHVQGADSLFEVLEAAGGNDQLVPDWLERFTVTHPMTDDRIDNIRSLAAKNGWSATGELTLLPTEFKQWLSSAP